MDEVYEKSYKSTSTQVVMPRVIKMAQSLHPRGSFEDDWNKIYDEAAAWFANEVSQQYGYVFMSTHKMHNRKDVGISLMKDIFIHNAVSISDRCHNLYWELEQYIADDKGNFPKFHDHLIDCFRYFLSAANYSMVEIMEAARALMPRILGDEPRRDVESGSWGDMDDDWTSVFD
jgi:hypothetical protein